MMQPELIPQVLNTGDADVAAQGDDEYKEDDEEEAFAPGQKRRAKRSTTKEKGQQGKKNAAFRLVRNLNRILDELVRI